MADPQTMGQVVSGAQDTGSSGGNVADLFRQWMLQRLGGGADVLGKSGSSLDDLMSQLQAAMPQMGADLPGGQFKPNQGVQNELDLPQFTSEGFTPDAMAALLGKNIDKQNSAFDMEGANLKKSLARRGIYGAGDDPGSGISSPLLAQLASSKAQAGSNAIRDTILANQDQLYKNRANLSMPLMKIIGDFATSRNKNLADMGIAGNHDLLDAWKTTGDQELKRRNLMLDALSTGFKGVGMGTDIANSMQSPIGSMVSGSNNGMDVMAQMQQLLGQLKGTALQDDRSGIGRQLLNTAVGAAVSGVSGGLGGLISNAGQGLSGSKGGKP